MSEIIIIAAVASNGVIGTDGITVFDNKQKITI